VARADQVSIKGKIVKNLPNANWVVEIPNGQQITAYLGGKLRKNSIRIGLGDEVQLEMSPYSMERARIVYRF
jgi:translation initiation factor IF-1